MSKRSARLGWHVAMSVLIAVSWIAPLAWFHFQLVRHGQTVFTVLYALRWLLSALVLLLPQAYFTPRPFERNGRLYQRLGVRFFRRFMLQGDYYNRHLQRHDRSHRQITGRYSASRFDRQTRASERGHLMHLGYRRFAVLFAISNVVFNVYPIVLQRYTRGRIYNIRSRFRPEV